MRILQIVPSLANKAPVAFSFSLAREMRKMGFHVSVCYLKEAKFERVDTAGIECFGLRDLKGRLGDFDIIHSHMLLPNLVSVFFFGKKRVSTIHSDIWRDLEDSHGNLLSKIFSRIWLLALNQNDRNICLTDYHYSLYSDKIRNTVVIPNGISNLIDNGMFCDDDVIKKISEFYVEGQTIFSVGAFRKLKGLEQILLLLNRHDKKKCVFFGDGPIFEELKEYAKTLGISSRCLFLGFIKKPEAYYQYCDCLLITSRSEGFPLSLLEVINCKKPVVCSNIPTLVNLFDGMLYKYCLDDIESLSNAVDKAIIDGDKVEKLYSYFSKNYTLESIASQYIASYKEM